MIATPAPLVSAALRHPAKRPYGQSDRNSRLLRKQKPYHPHPCSPRHPDPDKTLGLPTHSFNSGIQLRPIELKPQPRRSTSFRRGPTLSWKKGRREEVPAFFQYEAGGRRSRLLPGAEGGGTTPGISCLIKLGSRFNAYKTPACPCHFAAVKQPWRRP